MKKYQANLTGARLTDDQITGFISDREAENTTLNGYKSYFKGQNTAIEASDGETKLQVPYARTLILITVGFMYKPGLIRYAAKPGESDKLLDQIQEVFEENDEQQLNTELGQDQATYGEAYELHYMDNEAEENFARVEPQNFIPIYSYDIKPKLVAGIYFYEVENDDDETVTYVDIYYADIVQKKILTDGSFGEEDREPEKAHPYGQVPVAIFKNNTDSLSDIAPIKGLLDAYDSLISCYIDDEKKFAEAVLLIFGTSLDDEALDKLERLRLIDDLDKDMHDFKYLTKDESQNARNELIEIIKQEIHRHSFVPDMTDPSVLGQKSGEAFQYLFALFELLAAVKESYFNQGIRDRLKLTAMGMSLGKNADIKPIQVKFTRNLPKDNVMWADIVASLWGMLPAEALIKLLPFVEDPDGLIESMKDEETGDGQNADEVKKLYEEEKAKSEAA